jgi:hypothetical protein
MGITLPYRFDTAESYRTIVRNGSLGVGSVVLAGLLYSTLVSHDYVVVTRLAVMGAGGGSCRSGLPRTSSGHDR